MYDLVIIGGGAGGFAAAMQAEALKASTLMVNGGLPAGGTCVNVGCVPSKHLLEVGHDRFYPQRPRFSALSPADLDLDFSRAIREKDALVAALRKSNYLDVLESFRHVEYEQGLASFAGPDEIEVDGRRIRARRFVLATGSTTRVPPVAGIEEVPYLTNESILSLDRRPESLLVLGGGPLGLEFAQMFHHFGSRVTVLELLDRVLPLEEPEISQEILRHLEEEGLEIHTSTKAKAVGKVAGGISLRADTGGGKREFRAEQLLVATGIAAKTEGLGLERTGVALDERSFV